MRLFLALMAALAVATPAAAESIVVAVAANFTQVATALTQKFEAATGDEVKLSFASTGALYTQIAQGAPFDVFLSADDQRTARAIAEGLAVAGTEFTYAVGRVVLYGPGLDLRDGAAMLAAGGFQHVAIAEPGAAPYGAAALAVLDYLGLSAALRPKIVTGENITQTLQFVTSGSAELGFVALSQVIDAPATEVWAPPPQSSYPPIRQNGVLLVHGARSEAARAFLDFLKGPEATGLIEAAGYDAGGSQ